MDIYEHPKAMAMYEAKDTVFMNKTLEFQFKNTDVTTKQGLFLSTPEEKHQTMYWVAVIQSNVRHTKWFRQRNPPALRASKQACPISSFSSWFSEAMASPTATKRPTATLTAWPTLCMAARVRSDLFGLSLWLIRVVIYVEKEKRKNVDTIYVGRHLKTWRKLNKYTILMAA